MTAREEIIDLETRFWQTIIDRDGQTSATMMADACIVTGAQGVASIDKKTFAKMMAEGQWRLEEFSFGKIAVNFPTPEVAVIGYKVSEKLVVDGERLDFAAADASVWIKRDGRWRCALHTESPLGDPFGRDKARR